MPSAIERTGHSTLNLRIDPALKAEFVKVVEAENRPASDVVRELMRRYVDGARQRRFAVEAQRQSQMIADSKDETEVMRWIQDVSAMDSEQ